MSYLETRITRKEFIQTRGSTRTQESANMSLRLFDYFCKGVHRNGGDEIIIEIQTAIKQDGKQDRLFRLCNSFVQWLQADHPEMVVRKNFYLTSIKKHNPSSIKIFISYLRMYLEEFGQI